jgi:hypothetical protein
MIYEKADFRPFSADAQRIMANLEQAYGVWLDARRLLLELPVSLYWVDRAEQQYLYAKQTAADSGTSLGARSADTEQQLAQFTTQRNDAQQRLSAADELIATRAALYRRMRLPSLPDKQAEILRKLDVEGLLGTDVMVVGTNAFAAYEWFANATFPVGNEETQDFDLTWCRDTPASLVLTTAQDLSTVSTRKTLLGVLKSIDSSYQITARKPYQAVNAEGYEVELLAAPSCHPLPKNEAFKPMASLIEQEWLLMGRPFSAVVATLRSRVCPLVVPDPRFMGLHKLWLADKPERNPAKREKDRRQGNVLLDAVRHFMSASHPLNVDFVFQLPEELRPVFDQWCEPRHFVPEP